MCSLTQASKLPGLVLAAGLPDIQQVECLRGNTVPASRRLRQKHGNYATHEMSGLRKGEGIHFDVAPDEYVALN